MSKNPGQSAVTAALQRFIDRFQAENDRVGTSFPLVNPDPGWRSECQYRDDDPSIWTPIRQNQPVDFRGLEHALELSIHEDIKAYYGSFWSATLEANAEEGHVSLIQLWNEQDFDRLVENLIGHALSKRRSKRPMTVFVANTEPDSEYFLSIENDTGILALEHPSRGVQREVAVNIAVFLDRLTPDLQSSAIF